MKSSKPGRPLMEVLLFEIVMAFIMIAVVAFAMSVSGCVAYPRTLASTPLESIVEKTEVVWGVQAGPDDAVEVPVKVGELRAALATAERYKGAVALQNLAVDQVMVMVEAYDGAAESVRRARLAGILNTCIGVAGGVAIGSLIMLFVR